MRVSILLAAKAEIVLGALLVMRHRVVRVVAVLALVTVLVSSVQYRDPIPLTDHLSGTTFIIAGALAAVAGSRALAPGPALAASRHVAAQWWLIPYGRLAGTLLLLLPAVNVAAFCLRAGTAGSSATLMAVTVYSTSIAALVLSIAPAIGGSAASLAGLFTVLLGSISNLGIEPAVVDRSFLSAVFHASTKIFPTPVMAANLVGAQGVVELLVLVGWVGGGVLAAGWAIRPDGRKMRHSPEDL